MNEVIWSDGPTAEFKNKFMSQFTEILSLKYNKPFTWKFSAISHGKGVVDEIGGKVTSTVRPKVRSQEKNYLSLQDASFGSAAKKLISSTKIIHIGQPQIFAYKDSNPFEGTIKVKGISKMHMMEVDGEKTFLWQSCAFHTNSKLVDIVLNKREDIEVKDESIDESIVTTNTTDQMNLNPTSYDDVKIGMFVITFYEDEKWLGNVVNKKKQIKFVFIVWKNRTE